MNKIQLFILLFSMVCSCSSTTPQNKTSNKDKMNREYKRLKLYFDPLYVSHFPENIEELPAAYVIDTNRPSGTNDHVRFMLYTSLNEKADSLVKQAIEKYRADDSCLLVVNRFTTRENWHHYNKYDATNEKDVSRDCYEGKYPIPNFYDSYYLTDSTETKLPGDFTLYVLEAKSGKFWGEDHITRGRYMPEGWKNGYSKGVAISEERNTIIYWFIIW